MNQNEVHSIKELVNLYESFITNSNTIAKDKEKFEKCRNVLLERLITYFKELQEFLKCQST